MNSPWPYFSLPELQCKDGCGSTGLEMSDEFMRHLIVLREKFGPITLSSAYRCKHHNNAVSNTGLNGPHTTGKAVDILIFGEKAKLLLKFILEDDYFTGIGINQKGDIKSRFIHIDSLTKAEGFPRPMLYSY